MADRKYGKNIPLRKHVPWRVYDAINRRTCLHVDAWIYLGPDDEIYLALLLTAGGHTLFDWRTYRIMRDPLTGNVELIPKRVERDWLESKCLSRSINSAWGQARPWLADLHDKVILPSLRQPIEGPFKGYRSIALHYIRVSQSCPEPFDDAVNHYALTGHARRHGHDYITDDGDTLTGMASDGGTEYTRQDKQSLRLMDKILGTAFASPNTENKT